MTLRKRIVLLVCGVLIFLLAAPVLILTARGYRFDFASRKLIKTGTVVIKTDPRGAAVFVNEQNRGSTPFTKRFLLPARYSVSIAKPGYLAWKKTIDLYAQELRTLPAYGDRIYLLRDQPEITAVATSTPPLLPEPNAALASQYQIANSTSTATFVFRPGDAEPEIIAPDLPKFNKSQIIVSAQKQIFLLLDDTLYEVGSALVKINDRIDYAYYDDSAEILVYGNKHEIWLWHPQGGQQNELVTRVSEEIGPATFSGKLGYFFYMSGGKIFALEYDPHLPPNLYVLANAETASPAPLWLSPDSSELSYFTDGTLTTLKIR